ncbi:Cdc40p KNAG_0C04950 [Huiozyma naganishii CBS 8797]|uniref:Pre-mRNA-processing factor 17 n=1 Tax=Huiozyma naganishii (strain ATCC MYA-139 / BCRC 22969 / CBS 8797 / KCTC 17520 / NBRC 10181 / NCYC 3082 / Yp74L-3) TaxID=1071383 RepID=J7S685_HUIN7|nr:hypothetical protein KNAG_0C04950 [Kazachstania naganishii CBS 8797]CCK69596.1 hypothetical protein KNAG_0C04950 [Kazachstania naganishii CBS 8797]
MELLNAYASQSESESESGDALRRSPDENSLKRRFTVSKGETQRWKRKRKAAGPWESWSSSESDGDAAVIPDIVDQDDVDGDASNSDGGTTVDGDIADAQSRYYGPPGCQSSLLSVPSDVAVDLEKPPLSFKCYLPKTVKATFSGHRNGTNTLQFIPNTGHLFMSGGNDAVVRLWDFYHDRRCVRDYRSHSKGIRATRFVPDGSQFLSASFDQTVNRWDTETGTVLQSLSLRSTPTAVDFRPQHGTDEYLVGLSDSRILHYDTRVDTRDGLVQTYDHHLGGILALRYFPDGTKFISSSEDKTVRIWDSGVNIPVKQISDTTQHSMPSVSLHPAGGYFVTQSMDNVLYTYSLRPKYRRHQTKLFRGQRGAGYGIGVGFSPDGKYVCSGDSKSKVLVWDWTTTKLLRELRVPGRRPITQVEWHPQETSKVICSGAAGKIYMFD